MSDRAWYSDKELFEMIQDLKQDLIETRIAIKKYNGLWDKFNDVNTRLIAIEQQAVGRKSVGDTIVKWGGWLVALAGFISNWVGKL